MRIGLGCMRLSTEANRDDARSLAILAAALDAGVRDFDTAHAYGLDESDVGHSERLLGQAVRGIPEARILTKCGMRRPEGRWEPDGRSRTILADARASVAALGRPPDVLFLHAPDPKVALETSVRALVEAQEEGLTRAIGLSNPTRKQLEIATRIGPISAVEVALGAYDDVAARGGVVAWCAAHGVPLFAHSPLGGPARAPRLANDSVLAPIAARHGVSAAEIVIAYLLASSPVIVPLVGARRASRIAGLVSASRIALDEVDLAALDARYPGLSTVRRPPRAPPGSSREVAMLMGISGAGKSRLAESYVARGAVRLNRDTLGGTLAGIAKRLGEVLRGGAERVVLDNTYVTRASRSDVLRVAHAEGAVVRCIFVDTPRSEAEINVVLRMLERHGELVGGADLRARSKRDPGLVAPSVLGRMVRDLEPPSVDEGFASIETLPFARVHRDGAASAAIPIELVSEMSAGRLRLRRSVDAAVAEIPPDVPLLLFGWREGASAELVASASAVGAELATATGRVVEVAVCTHAGGPPVCWCRPPLPGLWLAFARKHGIAFAESVLVVTSSAHRTMARNLGLRWIDRGEAREAV